MNDWEDLLVFGGVGVLGLLFLFGLAAWADSASCRSKWEASNMQSRWSIMTGCVIQQKDGTWIPAENYREMQ